MQTIHILWRNMKWRYQNPISILLTIIQPVLWLVLYSTVASQSVPGLNQEGGYTTFILPGVMVLVTLACCSSGGFLNFITKSSGSFYRILIAPVRRSAIVLGQVLEAVLLSILEVIVLLGIGTLMSVRIASGAVGIFLLACLICLTAFCMASLSYTISLSLPNEVVYETLMNLIVLTLFFTSPALFPMDHLNTGIHVIVSLNPITPVIESLRNLIINPIPNWSQLGSTAFLFTGLGLASHLLAVWKLSQEHSR